MSLLANCPECPEIKKKIDRIFEALLGDDGLGMKSGLVYELTQLKGNKNTQDSWFSVGKPVLVTVLTSVVTAAITYMFAKGFL